MRLLLSLLVVTMPAERVVAQSTVLMSHVKENGAGRPIVTGSDFIRGTHVHGQDL